MEKNECFEEFNGKKKHQPPLDVDGQINNLLKIGLSIEDKEEAKAFLNDVSYFRLIKAFSLGLKPANGNYYSGTTFNQIVDLYKFNCKFRQMLFPVIERIEINLRCRLANYFSCEYGIFGYLDKRNFENEEYYNQFYTEFKREVDHNRQSPFVKNFLGTYTEEKIPMYAAVELFSFGMLSKFFGNMKAKDKKAVAAAYGVKYRYLESWVRCISYVRNICAHYGRLYNAKLAIRPLLYDEYQKMNMQNYRIFSVLLCISKLVPNDEHWNEFVYSLDDLIREHPYVELRAIEFPENWTEFLAPAINYAKI